MTVDATAQAGFLSAAQSRERAESVARRLIVDRYDKPSLVSKIASQIAVEIIEDIRQPCEHLDSVGLARLYQTSRTPVREALMLLEKEGLVEMPPRRRTRVRALSITEIRDIYRIRAELLGLVARDIMEKSSPADIQTLHPMLEGMRAASEIGDINAFFWANVDFHQHNTELARNPTAKTIIDSLLLRTLRLRRIGLSQPGRLRRSYEDHERLFRAYQDGDADLAAALIRSNHITGLTVLESVFRAKPTAKAAEA